MHIKRTFLVGCGGTGSALAPLLARLLKYHPHCDQALTLIDGDNFEHGNRTRQPAEAGVGGNKAQHLRNLLGHQQLSSETVAAYLSAELLGEIIDNQEDGSADLIILAVDNNATRRMVIDTLESSFANFALLMPGNSDIAADPLKADMRGQVLWWVRHGNQVFGRNPTPLYHDLQHPDDDIPVAGSCTEHAPSNPQLLSANALSAAWTLSIVQQLLDGNLPADKHACFFDGRSGISRYL